jgi:thiol-disulfide isomerase/thioredoxin
MKLKICLLGLLCLYFSANAQNNVLPVIKIGEKMPDVPLTHVMNARYKNARLSDFKGKLILLDFWDVWCGSCIAGFPELDSLQRVFPSQLQIFLVNQHDSEKQIKLLFNRLNLWSALRIKVPIVYQDTLFARYFKFLSIPSCAWISPDGRLIGFTDKDQVTAANIQRMINGEKVDLPLKDDYAVKPFKLKHSKPTP